MKLLGIWTVLFAATASVGTVAIAADYSPEINSIRDRERIYVNAASAKLQRLHRYKQAWLGLGDALQIISRPKAPSIDVDIPVSFSRKQLIALSRELAQVEVTLNEIQIIGPSTNRALAALSSAAKGLPELEDSTAAQIKSIQSSLRAARTALLARKQRAERLVEKWIQWQVDEYTKLQVSDRQQVLSDLQFQDAVWQIRTPILNAHRGALRALEAGDLATAQSILDGISYMKAIAPAFIAGRITSSERQRNFYGLISDATQIEKQLVESIAELRSAQRSEHAEIVNEEDLYASMEPMGMVALYDPTATGFSNVPGNRPGSKANARETGWRDPWGNKAAAFEQGPHEKGLVSYGSILEHQGVIQIEGNGFLQMNETRTQPKEYVPLSSGPKFEREANRNLTAQTSKLRTDHPTNRKTKPSESSSGSASTGIHIDPPATESHPVDENAPLPEKLSRMITLTDRTIADTHEPRDIEQLNTLKQDTIRFQAQNTYFENEIEVTQDAVASVRSTVTEMSSNLRSDSGTQVSVQIPENTNLVDDHAAFTELQASIADLALGVIPVVGNAYNFTNFVTTMVTNHTVFGSIPSGYEKAILGVAAVLPFMGEVPAAARFINSTARIIKGRIKALSIAARYAKKAKDMSKVPKLLPLVGDEIRAFEGLFEKRIFQSGVLFQAQNYGQAEMGRWFTFIPFYTGKGAETMLNIEKWNKRGEQIAIYVIKDPVPAYFGKVAYGTGTQVFIKLDKDALPKLLEKVEVIPLGVKR